MRIEIINKYLEDGYVSEAKQVLQEYYLQQDRQEFEVKLQAEYDELFPKYMDMTDEEILENNSIFNEDGTTSEQTVTTIAIDYSQDENHKTFEEYKNETKVIQEASYVCDECQLALDNELCINNEEHTTRLIPEVTELVRPYIAKDVTDRVEEYINNSEAYKAILKAKKKELLDTITVEVNGKVFDGNETARNNMLASIQASQLFNVESAYWKLADNSVVEVTVDEIKEALALAIQRVGEIVTNG